MQLQPFKESSNIIPYEGMTSLFTNNSTVNLTDEALVEYHKCKNDINYFHTFIKIRTLDHGYVQYKPFDYQKKITNTVKNNKLTIILTPRQYGKTTAIEIDILHNILFNQGYEVFIGADTVKNAYRILATIKKMYMALPLWLKWGVGAWKESSMSVGIAEGPGAFTNTIEVGATNKVGGRGRSYNYAYWDEAAFCSAQHEFYSSIYSTMSTGDSTKFVITSTPAGYDLFYELWQGAIANENGYKAVKVNWQDHPDKDENYLNDCIKKLGKKLAMIEIACEFAGSGDTLLDVDDSIALRETAIKKYETDVITSAKIYNEVVENAVYLITIDLGSGNGGNRSVANVFRMSSDKAEQVAILYTNELKSNDFAANISIIQKKYNNAYILYERNGLGQFFDSLLEMAGVDNILSLTNTLKIARGGSKKGFTSTESLKLTACDEIVNGFKDRLILVDEQTISEIISLEKKGNAYSKPRGGYDDCADTVMQCALIMRCSNYDNYFYDAIESNSMGSLAESRLNSFLQSNKKTK